MMRAADDRDPGAADRRHQPPRPTAGQAWRRSAVATTGQFEGLAQITGVVLGLACRVEQIAVFDQFA